MMCEFCNKMMCGELQQNDAWMASGLICDKMNLLVVSDATKSMKLIE